MNPLGFVQFPTTADVGIFAYADSFPSLIDQTSQGMMNVMNLDLISNQQSIHHGQWSANFPQHLDNEMILLRWLDEVLFHASVLNQYYVEGNVSIQHKNDGIIVFCDVIYIQNDTDHTGLEIKAVTSHECFVHNVPSDGSYVHKNSEIPEIIGPAWVSQVIVDV